MKKGQHFTVFKLLMAGVFAMTLLTFVYYVLEVPSSPFLSSDLLKELADNSKKAPGLCFEREEIEFIEGERITFDSVGAYSINRHSDITGTIKCFFSNKWCDVIKSIKVPAKARTDNAGTHIVIGSKCPF